MKNVSVKKMNGKGKNAFRAVLIVVALIFATCFALVLVACVPTEVQIEKVTSESEVNRLVSANFSEEDAVRDEMTKQYGALSDFEYNNGKATANVERNGKSYAVSAEIDLGASDFEVTKYTNAELSGNNLTYTSEGQDVSENVSDKIVVEENGAIYVIDPSGALNTISIAVSDAILTENVDPENPGGEENPDPDEPENPGGEENPDPENPGGEENPDPDKPGEGEEGKPDEGGEGEPDPEEPTEITFDSWEELMNIENSAYYDDILEKMSEIVKREMVNTYFVQGVVGNISGRPATTLENTDTLRIGYNFNENGEIKEIIWTGVKYGHSSDTDAGIVYATVPMVTPISSDVVKVYTNSSENINNDSVVCGSNIIDLSGITGKIKYNEKSIKVQSRYGDRQLTEENQQYFDLCMQLAVNADAIGENSKLAFVTVQGSSSTNNDWGTTYNIVIKCVDVSTNKYYDLGFVFDDDKKADNMIDRIKSAISREQFSVSGGEESALMSSSDIIFEFDALGNVVTYTIPQKEGENQA